MYYVRITDHIKGVLVMKFSLAIDKIKTSLGAGDARAPAKFRGSEKRKERKKKTGGSTPRFKKLPTALQITDKRTDAWSRNFMIWKINFGLWAVAWAGLWEKGV